MCDTFVATPDYTASGSMILGKNSDREPNEAQTILRIPAADHEEKTLKATFIAIPQVRHTFEVLLSKPFQMWGAEMGANEHGLMIGNEAVFTRVKFSKKNDGLTGMDLLRLALERADCAARALETITSLLETCGQDACGGYENRSLYYHNSFIIADKKEAYVLETAGRQWAALKAKGFRSISNGLTIEEEFDLSSPDCIDYARRQGWLKPHETFSFRRSYTDRFFTFFSKCALRRARTTLLGGNRAGAFTAETAMDILRTEGDPLDKRPFHPARSDMGSVCLHATGPVTPSQTNGSLVGEVRTEGSSTFWLTGTSIPSTAPFIPFSLPGRAPLQGKFEEPSGRADGSLWWQHEALYRLCLRNYPEAVATFRSELESLQKRFNRRVAEVVAGGASASLDALSEECLGEALQAIRTWKENLKGKALPRKPFAPLYRCQWRLWNRKAGLEAL
ncbi:MAG: C69 family dipeptidase [Deltaproteobacteria bacterium]|nr:C69 family dipeptidase [Deltaproteobacteria bacterium]